ncbi:MAG: 2'-5' RNA ligase family protein [Bacteroidales bacterium]
MKGLHDNHSDLYFIALIPHRSLREEIREIKERVHDDFGAGHALKSPAHITLQIPFKRISTDESRLAEALRRFAASEHPFTVYLNGYGAFAPRVIIIKIVEHGPVAELHSRLKKVLLEDLHFHQDEVMKSVQPHITVATRDLTEAAFSEAWTAFKEEEFSASFDAESIFLLKHNGRSWDILEEFPFRDNG